MLCSPRCPSPRAGPTLVQPQVMPQVIMYVCMWSFGTGSHACHGVKGARAGCTTSASNPQSIDREVVHAQCFIRRQHLHINMYDVYHPILTWGRCSHTWGHGQPGCSPTWGHSEARCCPNVAPPPPVRGLPNILQKADTHNTLFTEPGAAMARWLKIARVSALTVTV